MKVNMEKSREMSKQTEIELARSVNFIKPIEKEVKCKKSKNTEHEIIEC